MADPIQTSPDPQPQNPNVKSWTQDPSQRPQGIQSVVFSRPVPGQSWTMPPKSTPWQKPPQFVDLETFVEFLMDQLTEPQHLKEVLTLSKLGISVEEFVRVILFTAFATGKCTPTLAMLAYKPLMLGVIAILHRAGQSDARVVMPHRMKDNSLQRIKMIAAAKDGDLPTDNSMATQEEPNNGFMQRAQ